MNNKTCLLLFFILTITACNTHHKPNHPHNVAMVISLSTDGKYAISSHINQQLVLWNLQNRNHKTITNNANIYSAYFVKNTKYFMWQDANTNRVYVENIHGKIINSFNPGFSSYGEAMNANLTSYYAIDSNWNLVIRNKNGQKYLLKNYGGNMNLVNAGKLINFSLVKNRLLTTGTPLIHLWNTKNNKLMYKFSKNLVKTFALLNPDAKYIVSGDENCRSFTWDAHSGRLLFRNADPIWGKYVKFGPNRADYFFEKNRLIKQPADFKDYQGIKRTNITAIAFVDKTHYLRFTYAIPYAILYSVKTPWPIKYFRLGIGQSPNINIYSYLRDNAIASAPKAHIVVIGQAVGSGIVVYRYNPEQKTLKRIIPY